jgi:hypothetical protein
VEEEKRLQRREGGKTMKEEEQKFHNLNPWPYNLPLNLAFVRRVLTEAMFQSYSICYRTGRGNRHTPDIRKVPHMRGDF